MADKALISELTWRSLEMQRDAFPDMPHFIAPDEIPQLLRPTSRKSVLRIHVKSYAVIADNERDFRAFLTLAKKRNCEIICRDEALAFGNNPNVEYYVAHWRKVRKAGVSKIGGRKSADLRKANSAEGVEKIRGRWPMSSKEWPTRLLLDEAGLSLNTVKATLGNRPIAQYNYQAAQKRKAKKAGKL